MNEIPQRTLIQKFHVKFILWFGLFIFCLVASSVITGVNFELLVQNISQFFELLTQMAHPDWAYTKYILSPLLETIQMAVIGTSIGTIVALPVSFIAARTVIKNKFVTGIVRFFLNLMRTLPDLLLAALFVAIVGIGPVAGVATLAVFSFAMISKLFYEAIETIDIGSIEALTTSGANKIQIIMIAIIPQVLNNFISYFLYTFEINVRASTVLGYLGAGGIGVYLQRSLSSFRYDQTAVIIIAIFVVVVVIDTLSNVLREKFM
ncbi:phosphonate ABC transporter, permease protein PhnE [Companilactobacillus sp. RD055328]|uniref:phosphonate ABC transporter, permease protein PhnE n=1 Tax=Companilactobacillus sp. RD055328 TaxID=2916634 RepID=UPI001FC81499|nr:phosphonate ABC transporter, permease protein PhnE [Companilactobacillus sp. RD055328]GKQ43217.1 phosphonate ABC transporter, permease protein PhnE [Companilactobacillus sp. RD055328]